MANLFMAFEPLAGPRYVQVTQRKTSIDFAHFLQQLSDVHYLQAQQIVRVCDNPSTHTRAALYEAFDPATARRLSQRFEWHDTPKQGSWLNMAKCELSVLSRQCLKRRIPDMPRLIEEVAA